MAKRKKSEIHSLSYTEQLEHPLWQKKSAEVKDRAGWKCEDCGSKEKQLSAHHCYYEYGKLLWEYDFSTLICLCWDCHQDRQTLERDAKLMLAQLMRRHQNKAHDPTSRSDLQKLIASMAQAIGIAEDDDYIGGFILVDRFLYLTLATFSNAFSTWSGVPYHRITAGSLILPEQFDLIATKNEP